MINLSESKHALTDNRPEFVGVSVIRDNFWCKHESELNKQWPEKLQVAGNWAFTLAALTMHKDRWRGIRDRQVCEQGIDQKWQKHAHSYWQTREILLYRITKQISSSDNAEICHICNYQTGR